MQKMCKLAKNTSKTMLKNVLKLSHTQQKQLKQLKVSKIAKNVFKKSSIKN